MLTSDYIYTVNEGSRSLSCFVCVMFSLYFMDLFSLGWEPPFLWQTSELWCLSGGKREGYQTRHRPKLSPSSSHVFCICTENLLSAFLLLSDVWFALFFCGLRCCSCWHSDCQPVSRHLQFFLLSWSSTISWSFFSMVLSSLIWSRGFTRLMISGQSWAPAGYFRGVGNEGVWWTEVHWQNPF